MSLKPTRRGLLQGSAVLGGGLAVAWKEAAASGCRVPAGWVQGHLTGAEAIVDTLLAEGCRCVFGIPGAQENELWDTLKTRGLPYLLVTHEFSAACMADGAARASGVPGVLTVVPGPGVTNALSGLGEALLDSIPLVAIVGDVARGAKYKPFQVHSLDQVALLRPVTKAVLTVERVGQIPDAIRQAFVLAQAGEPGPIAVVIPYPLLIEKDKIDSAPQARPVCFDEAAFRRAVALLADRRLRIGIYAGLGCLDAVMELRAVAELLQAPVATSLSGKGSICETHPLAVGWGYGPHAGRVAERVFEQVDCVLAIGVKYAEVSTGFYSNPQTARLIHVDAEAANLGRVMRTDVCVQADAGLFLGRLLAEAKCLHRACDDALVRRIAGLKEKARNELVGEERRCGIDPLQLIHALRRCLPEDGLLFVDVTASEHLAGEAFSVLRPRTWFLAADNQAMGWSIPAALGAQQVCPGRTVATLTGDGCMLMSGLELSTAARAQLPVKFFILDDQAYHYMQILQEAAYLRTTATKLARLDYPALARGLGIPFLDISEHRSLASGVATAMQFAGPVLVRVKTDYGDRKIRWIEAVRRKYTKELTAAQKARFLTRIGARAIGSPGRSD